MDVDEFPDWYAQLRARHGGFMSALEELGQAVREEGPLDERAIQLVQLAAAAAIRSEGAVHSHARRALDAGASPEEVFHALVALTSTIGFPNVSAALSWVEDILQARR
ncbi:carboxymuconolactone decarboxylase family protein [Ectothiorhodospiraceae bacterium 2226]|nr:carboxymuconolactone decarboxylase family protein [Ectothiorhodospiraceae bacterium 2226]